MLEDLDSKPPPPYGPLDLDDETANKIERNWDIARSKGCPCDCVDGCPKYLCLKGAQVWFGFQAKHRLRNPGLTRFLGRRDGRPAWRAILQVWTTNVPRMMRRGLSWSSTDLLPGGDRIQLHNSDSYMVKLNPKRASVNIRKLLSRKFARSWGSARDDGCWPHCRVFRVTPTQGSKIPDTVWMGCLFVFSDEPSQVINFDIRSITTDSTVWGWAIDNEASTVFNTRGGPTEACNTIFPGHLQWWSCPGDNQRKHSGKAES